ncbi:single-stranded-DNA-specific exonuclease RecJ [Aliikangiella sp. IMCC44632]
MNTKKIIHRKVDDKSSQLKQLPLKLQGILAARGVTSPIDLDFSLANLIPPDQLLNNMQAASHLFKAVKANQSILIIGDFDADGATSSSIMVKGLKMLGAKRVNFLVPDRFKFGYGLSVELVDFAATLKPDLIITVDNGISNIDGVAKANQLNIPVIITDHHLAAEQLPDALCIVNPNQPNDRFASKNLAGVGVAFYLLLALRGCMRNENWFTSQNIEEPNLACLLDIVALGTVADVVILDKNNRILVEQGLKRIRSGLACPGIMALLQIANRDYRSCQASDLGFAIGPRLNAAGRLDDMSIGINCLLANSLQEALPIATRLDTLNRNRQSIEGDMLAQAEADLASYFKHNQTTFGQQRGQAASEQLTEPVRPTAMCLFDPNWHQGVIGILASRVKDKLNRPVIVFAKDDDSNEPSIKGSARSVKGVHIRDVLALIDGQNPTLIEKFGGHAMAAGLSIKEKDYSLFSEKFHDGVLAHLNGDDIKDELVTDASLSAQDLSLDFAQQLRGVGPWGQGFPEPLFDDQFTVVSSRLVGEKHLKLQLEKDNQTVDGIYFRCPEDQRAETGDKIHAVYKLDINEFRGNVSLQLMLEQLEII